MKPAVISSIEPDSIAEELGWQAGDHILSINGQPLQDILDYRYLTAQESLEVVIEHASEVSEYDIEKDTDQPLGVDFADPLFDGMHSCGAKCIFCFVEQLPKGLRKTLYIKDDDYRLSFLDGNFVTLANVSETELDRIIHLRLSPLYVSVHSTDHDLRQQIIGRESPDIMQQLKKLTSNRISIHAQIVLCPQINDQQQLAKTINDLATMHPQLASIAVVPVGLTGFRQGLQPIEQVERPIAAQVIEQVTSFQRRFLAEYGTRLVWVADEFYLLAGAKIPGNSTYEDYVQYENGVGLVRDFLNGVPASLRMLRSRFSGKLNVEIVTGASAYPLLCRWSESIGAAGLNIKVSKIINRTFGPNVTVAGLMCGRDIIAQLSESPRDLLLIPAVALNNGLFLDDVTTVELEKAIGCRVKAVTPLAPSCARAILELTA